MSHVHVGAMEFVNFVAMFLLAQLFLKALAIRFSETAFGKALGSIVA